MPTFAPGTAVPTVDDAAVYSSSPDLDTGFGLDDTPAGWPASRKVTAIEVELTVTAEFTADAQVQVAVAAPDTLAPVTGATTDASGVWTGWQGTVAQYRSGTADGYYLDKFGGWRTNYLTFSDSGATSTWLESSSSETPATGLDIRARVRSADWDGTNGRRICSTGIALGVMHCELSLTASGVFARVLDTAGTSTVSATAPWSAFTETDGQWLGIRFTLTGTTGTWYQDTSASETLDSWTSVHTATFTDANTTAATTIRVGSTNATTSGLNGDLSHWEIRDGGGAIIHRLQLDAMDASADTGWASPHNTVSRTDGGNTVNGATIPATKRVRIDLDDPFPITDVRLIVDAQTGELTVDEILLELFPEGWYRGRVWGPA